MSKQAQTDRDDAIRQLTEVYGVKPGDTIYTILRHVSRSGMQRRISLVVAGLPGEHPSQIDHLMPHIAGYRVHPDGGIVAPGAGMDMGYALVYDLARRLWPDGFGCIGEGCPSNDHSNGDRDYWHTDGGYALKHRWL